MSFLRRLTRAAVIGAALTMSFVPSAAAQTVAVAGRAETLGFEDLSKRLWKATRAGDNEDFRRTLELMSKVEGVAVGDDLGVSATALLANLQKRETDRLARQTEIREELQKHLKEEQVTVRISKSLRSAIELEMLAVEKGKVAQEPVIVELVKEAKVAASEAEKAGKVLTASEVFGLLNGLFEESAEYHDDVERVGQRLAMLRLYAPRELYDLRMERLKTLGEDTSKLPPYNSLGDNFVEKLNGIDQLLLLRAITFAARHVERPQVNDLLLGGLDNLEVMITTRDLASAFPKLADEGRTSSFLRLLAAEKAKIRESKQRYDIAQIEGLFSRMVKKNADSIELPETALLHEFGNGMMAPLDDYSVVIWPDEVRRFQKNTQGRFVGVGIQIEYDDQSRIKIATPLEGTPAQRAGIHSNDILSAVDGKNVYGLTLDQVVDVITGPAGTPVTLTIERQDPANAEGPWLVMPFELQRSIISVPSTRGWIRSGEKEDAWDYMIDHESGIGYIRLTQFTESTDDEIAQAISLLRAQGMKALIFDLRFNPGGLLDQAVKVARKFIRVEDGIIVQARGATGAIENPEYTRPAQAMLADVPVVMLINEGSASASEIVSGAVRCYVETDEADALLIGARSFGKGSVQNVWQIMPTAHLKLTVQYYMLPDRSIIHRRPGAATWGVEPHLAVEMLPKQTTDAILLRRDADVIPIDENGIIKADLDKRANPQDLLTKGLDLQLEAALMVLKARTFMPAGQAANTPNE